MSDAESADGYERCGGKLKKRDGFCRLPAGHGTDHVGTGRCRRHGGSTPTHKRHAERVMAEQAVVRFGLEADDTPAPQILLQQISRSSAMVNFLAFQVSGVAVEDLAWGTTRWKVRVDGDGQEVTEVEQEARPSIWLLLLDRERKALRELIETAHRCNIEERMARQVELEGALMVRLLNAVLSDPELALTQMQRAAIPRVVPRHLRAIGGEENRPGESGS